MNKSQWAEHLLRDEGFQMMMEELGTEADRRKAAENFVTESGSSRYNLGNNI